MQVPSRPRYTRHARSLAWYVPLCATLPLAGACMPVALADDQDTAQPAPAQGADAAAPTVGLQEVVVTATRREESLSKVPISVTALTAQDMDARGIKNIDDVVRYTPGITIDQNGTNNISIRGISSSGGAGTTGIYLDDTPIQMRTLAFNPDEALPTVFDMARVEVLRGPQGTLFGAGSEGGTVRYITTAPSLTRDSVLGRAEVDYTQNGAPSYEAGAAVGGPLIDGTLGARLTLWYRKDGGWIDMVNPEAANPATAITDSNANHDETYMARLAFLWQITDRWSVSPTVLFQKRDEHEGNAYWPIYTNGGNFVNGDPDVRGEPDTFYLPALKIEGDFGAFNFISNTSLYHRREQTGYGGTIYNTSFYQSFAAQDAAGNPLNDGGWETLQPGVAYPFASASGLQLPYPGYRAPNSIDNGQQNLTQEFRLVSADPASRLKWTAGLFYSQDRQTYLEQLHDPMLPQFIGAAYGDTVGDAFSYVDPASGDTIPGAYPLVPGSVDPLSNVTVPTNIDPFDNYYLESHAKDEQVAVYGEATYSITDDFKATVGLRESHTRFSMTSVTGGAQLFAPNTLQTSSTSENSFTPKVSLDWQINAQDMVYATYAKGFRPGGGNSPLPAAACGFAQGTNTPSTYNSDTVNSFEVGTKDGIGSRLKVAASLYYIRWNNIQQQIDVPVCELTYITNLGNAVAKGGDIQLQWLPVDALSVDLSMGYTDARFTKTTYSPFPDGTDANGNPVYDMIAHDGDAITAASGYANPPFTLSAGLEYSFNLHGVDSSLRLDYEYESHDKWPTPAEDPLVEGVYKSVLQLPATSYFNLRGSFHLRDDLTLEPFINNLTDTRAYTGYDSTDGTGLIRAYAFRPRTYGLTLTYRH